VAFLINSRVDAFLSAPRLFSSPVCVGFTRAAREVAEVEVREEGVAFTTGLLAAEFSRSFGMVAWGFVGRLGNGVEFFAG